MCVSNIHCAIHEEGRVALCIPPKQIKNKVNDIYRSSTLSYMTERSCNKSLIKGLGMRKVCARWVLHLLTKYEKKQRLDCSRKLLKKFKN